METHATRVHGYISTPRRLTTTRFDGVDRKFHGPGLPAGRSGVVPEFLVDPGGGCLIGCMRSVALHGDLMTFALRDSEWELLSSVPVDDLVGLAAELDILVPAEVNARQLIDLCVPRMVERARKDGLPFSKYDREDIEALSKEQVQALHKMLGLWGRASASSILRAGGRAYKARKRIKPGHDPYAYMIPVLLNPIVRCVMES